MGKASATATAASWAAAAAMGAYLATTSTGLKPFLTLTDRTSWAWEVTAMGFFMKIAQDNKERVAGSYWAKSLVATGIAAFGGGFLAPLVVAHTPVPLMEETFVWMVVVAWYATHHVPFVSDGLTIAMSTGPLKLLFSLFFSIFKTQQIVGAVELAAKAVAAEDLLPHSAYFPVAIAPCLLCGFLGGCGGAFLPLSTGLKPIEEGRVWNVRAAFFAPCIYVAATRYFGCDLLDAKMGICLFRLLGEVFPGPRDAALAPVTAALYASTRVRSSVVVPVAKDFSLGA